MTKNKCCLGKESENFGLRIYLSDVKISNLQNLVFKETEVKKNGFSLLLVAVRSEVEKFKRSTEMIRRASVIDQITTDAYTSCFAAGRRSCTHFKAISSCWRIVRFELSRVRASFACRKGLICR